MSDIYVRGVPDELAGRIRRYADARGVSIPVAAKFLLSLALQVEESRRPAAPAPELDAPCPCDGWRQGTDWHVRRVDPTCRIHGAAEVIGR